MSPFQWLYGLADRVRFRAHGDTGRRGEDIAHRYLRRKGLMVVARNWRPPQGGGEVDIVACDSPAEDGTLIFVEVKTRTSGEWSTPERAITLEKITSIRRAARDYVRRADADPNRVRFDVITVTLDSREGRIEHFERAFEG